MKACVLLHTNELMPELGNGSYIENNIANKLVHVPFSKNCRFLNVLHRLAQNVVLLAKQISKGLLVV